MMGISEHYEFVIPPLAKHAQTVRGFTDYLYAPGWSTDDLWNGLWGLMRAYTSNQTDLLQLPNNPNGNAPPIGNIGDFNGVCLKTAPVKNFDISAVAAQLALPNGTLVYNPRLNQGGKLHDPTAILFVRSGDLDAAGKIKLQGSLSTRPDIDLNTYYILALNKEGSISVIAPRRPSFF